MFVKKQDWFQLQKENDELKARFVEAHKKEIMFEDLFYSDLKKRIDREYMPPKSEPVTEEDKCSLILFQDAENIEFETEASIEERNLSYRFQDIKCELCEPRSKEIDKLMDSMEASFSDRLMELIREKNLDEVEVYKKADVDRRLFSKLRSNSDYRPKKDTAILLCMSMKLSLPETEDLLKRAGFAFSNSSKADIIAQYFFEKQIYDIFFYKEVLNRYGLYKE